MIASEALPFAKTGGLADVVSALPQALGRLGHRVTVVLPKYPQSRDVQGGTAMERFRVTVGGFTREAGFVEFPQGPNTRAILVDVPELYDREALYGVGNVDYPDNARRFAFLARAALEFAGRSDQRWDVLHAHDWQGGLAPVYLKTLFASHPHIATVASVFTIHNLAYQGLFPAELMPALDLGWDLFTPEKLEFWGQISFLKGGINFSDKITTVSRKYAAEIQTVEYGSGFEGVLRRRAADLVGITNGIDQDVWDPARDRFVPQLYSAADLSGKRTAKQEVLRSFGLSTSETTMLRPLVGMISRMVDQKGFDLLADAADELPGLDATFVLLGTGDPRYEKLWTGLALRYPDRIGVRIGFDERLAHLIEAGADIFLMPSRFEPCGLNQMYSLRYGTVPVVRATGGLHDTVKDYDPRTGAGTGFTFQEYTSAALLRALRRALDTYRKPAQWQRLQAEGMRQDHSWDASAREYVKIYERAVSASRPATVRREA